MKKILRTLLVVVMVIGICNLFGCTENHQEKYTTFSANSGLTYKYSQETETYFLTGDLQENNPSIWNINSYVNYQDKCEKEVEYFGMTIPKTELTGGSCLYIPSLKNVQELYLPYCMKVSGAVSYELSLTDGVQDVPKKITIVNNDTQNNSAWYMFKELNNAKDLTYYVSSYAYSIYKQEMLDMDINSERVQVKETASCELTLFDDENENGKFKTCKANTSYMFNYANSPNNGYFFINDFEYGEKIENVPYKPIRVGYEFAGWYKEMDCINIWDFNEDTLPQAEYNKENEEVYQETKLYAKWIKN